MTPAPAITSRAPLLPTLTPTPAPSSGGEPTSDSTTMIAGVSSAVGGVILIALGALRWRHAIASKKKNHFPRGGNLGNEPSLGQAPHDGSHSNVFAGGSAGLSSNGKVSGQPTHTDALILDEGSHGRGTALSVMSALPEPTLPLPPASSTALSATSAVQEPTLPLPILSSTALTSTSAADEPTLPLPVPPITAHKPMGISHAQAMASSKNGDNDRAIEIAADKSAKESSTATISTATMSTVDRAEVEQFEQRQRMANAASLVDNGTPGDVDDSQASASARRQGSLHGIGLGDAVMAAAVDLAQHCHIPGVSEAATALSILVKMVSDSRDSGSDAKLRQCRSIVRILERAGEVAEKGDGTMNEADEVLIEDVHFAISDLVELIKTYESKNKLSKLLTSTQFKRRQSELDVAVNQAITRLQLGLQVQISNDVSAVKDGIIVCQGSAEEAKAKSLVEARRSRRQRKLDAVEIPADQVEVSDELLGRGGFGEVFIARVYERNAAAKVLYICHELDQRGDNDVLEGGKGNRAKLAREVQKNAILRELEAMIRLRSPHTVNVYGAVTSLPDRLILVMELLVGGDLRTLLRNSEDALPVERARQIIGDVCAGMTFLHGKKTVHGDLKSANVLLDGAGRAKIGDFGTSRWSQHTSSTGLATYTKSPNTQMSLGWSAPEVLRASGCTYASDVYSFGIVAWEVLSRDLPWANLPRPDDVFIHVVLNGLRPELPAETPVDLADTIMACWAGKPEDRPAFSSIMKTLKSNGWSE
ncbi:unnamed protein product [Scytosiphon promiscuus]